MSKVNESHCGRICEEVEMRKGSFFILGSLLLFATLSYAATLERVLVRQQWPWHRLVKVEYHLTDVSSPVDISVSLSAGGTAVAVPADALDGASGWFGYVYPSSSATSSVSLTAGDEVCQRVLRPWMGVMLVVR